METLPIVENHQPTFSGMTANKFCREDSPQCLCLEQELLTDDRLPMLDQELTQTVKELFRSKYGEFSHDKLMKVARLLEFEDWEKRTSEKPMKMLAKKHIPDVIGIHLGYVLDAYDFEGCYPMTDNGVIVSGFWDPSKTPDIPAGYMLDENKRYLQQASL